jgi:hypothetical protein
VPIQAEASLSEPLQAEASALRSNSNVPVLVRLDPAIALEIENLAQ